MRIVLVLLIMQLMVRSDAAEVPRPPASNGRQLVAAAEQFAAAAKPITVIEFDITYSDGKKVERLRERAERTPADVKDLLQALRQSDGSGKLHLVGGFMFTTVLEQRIEQCEELAGILSEYAMSEAHAVSATTNNNRRRAWQWRVDLLRACSSLRDAKSSYELEFLDLLGEADRRLEACAAVR